MFTLESSLNFSDFFHAIYLFSISVMFFPFPYLTPKLFCFFCVQLLISPCALSINLYAEFSLVILEGPVWFVWLDSVLVTFESPLFCQYILIYFFHLCCQTCLFLSFWDLFILLGSCVFCLLSQFLYFSFYPHFPSRFCISVCIPLEDTYFIMN